MVCACDYSCWPSWCVRVLAGVEKASGAAGVLKLLPVLCECVSLCGGSMPFYPDFHEVPPLCRAMRLRRNAAPCMLLKLLEALLERSQLLERGSRDSAMLVTAARDSAMLVTAARDSHASNRHASRLH